MRIGVAPREVARLGVPPPRGACAGACVAVVVGVGAAATPRYCRRRLHHYRHRNGHHLRRRHRLGRHRRRWCGHSRAAAGPSQSPHRGQVTPMGAVPCSPSSHPFLVYPPPVRLQTALTSSSCPNAPTAPAIQPCEGSTRRQPPSLGLSWAAPLLPPPPLRVAVAVGPGQLVASVQARAPTVCSGSGLSFPSRSPHPLLRRPTRPQETVYADLDERGRVWGLGCTARGPG